MNIGFVGIVLGDREIKMKSCILKNATQKRLKELIENNLKILDNILDYLIEKDIHLFRISSGFIPFASHPVNEIEWWADYSNEFKALGKKAMQNNIRLSMHPGQYTTLSSEKKDLISKSISDLQYHTLVLDSMGLPPSNKVILHIGGIYDDKQKTLERFIENYLNLPKNIKSRLVLENDDKCYTAQDLLFISQKTGAPVIFDYLHFLLNHYDDETNTKEIINLCRQTWKKKDGNQKIHYSQQAENKKLGSHSLTIDPVKFHEFTKILPDEIDVMFEVKDKNLSVLNYFNYLNKKSEN